MKVKRVLKVERGGGLFNALLVVVEGISMVVRGEFFTLWLVRASLGTVA